MALFEHFHKKMGETMISGGKQIDKEQSQVNDEPFNHAPNTKNRHSERP